MSTMQTTKKRKTVVKKKPSRAQSKVRGKKNKKRPTRKDITKPLKNIKPKKVQPSKPKQKRIRTRSMTAAAAADDSDDDVEVDSKAKANKKPAYKPILPELLRLNPSNDLHSMVNLKTPSKK